MLKIHFDDLLPTIKVSLGLGLGSRLANLLMERRTKESYQVLP